jgi:hypothetical protein
MAMSVCPHKGSENCDLIKTKPFQEYIPLDFNLFKTTKKQLNTGLFS